jgi:hypothetical protein
MGQIAELIMAVLNGDEKPEALGPSWRADLMMPIYEEARRILELPKGQRRAQIERHPPEISRLVADEVTRLYRIKR